MHVTAKAIPAAVDPEITLAFAALVVDPEIASNIHAQGSMSDNATIFNYDFNDPAALAAFKDFETLQAGDTAARVGHPDIAQASPFVSSARRQREVGDSLSTPRVPGHYPVTPQRGLHAPSGGQDDAARPPAPPATTVPLTAPTDGATHSHAVVPPPTASALSPAPPIPAQVPNPPIVSRFPPPQSQLTSTDMAPAQTWTAQPTNVAPGRPQHHGDHGARPLQYPAHGIGGMEELFGARPLDAQYAGPAPIMGQTAASTNTAPAQTWTVQPTNVAPGRPQYRGDHGARPLQYPAHGIGNTEEPVGAHPSDAQYAGPAPIMGQTAAVNNHPLEYTRDTPTQPQRGQAWRPTEPNFKPYIPFDHSANHAPSARHDQYIYDGWTAPRNPEYGQGTWNAQWRPESISESLNTRGYALLPTPEPRLSAASATTQASSVASQNAHAPKIIAPKPKAASSTKAPAQRLPPPQFFSTVPRRAMPEVKRGDTKKLYNGDTFQWTLSNSNFHLSAAEVKVKGAVPGSLHFHTHDALKQSSVFMMTAEETWLDVTVNYYNPDMPRIHHPHYDLVLALRHNNKPNYITANHFATDKNKPPPTSAILGLGKEDE